MSDILVTVGALDVDHIIHDRAGHGDMTYWPLVERPAHHVRWCYFVADGVIFARVEIDSFKRRAVGGWRMRFYGRSLERLELEPPVEPSEVGAWRYLRDAHVQEMWGG